MVNYNDGKWHGWNGGECPVHPDTVVDVVLDGGERDTVSAGEFSWEGYEVNSSGTVIAFRVTKEHKEPREFWLSGGIVCSSIESAAKHDYAHNIIHVREVIE